MYRHDKTQRLKWETLQVVKYLRKRTDILYAEPNYIRSPSLIPNDQFYSFQWHYPLINLPQAWDRTTGGADVTVAVIDTGVLLAHPDLQGRFVPGYDFILDPANALDGDGRDPTRMIPVTAAMQMDPVRFMGPTSPGPWPRPPIIFRAWRVSGGTRQLCRSALWGLSGGQTSILPRPSFLRPGSRTIPVHFRLQPAAVINMSLGASGIFKHPL